MSKKKGASSSRNGRDSKAQRLGVKVYDGTTLATLTAGNFLAIGGIDGDTVSVGGSTSASYDTRNVGTAKASRRSVKVNI